MQSFANYRCLRGIQNFRIWCRKFSVTAHNTAHPIMFYSLHVYWTTMCQLECYFEHDMSSYRPRPSAISRTLFSQLLRPLVLNCCSYNLINAMSSNLFRLNTVEVESALVVFWRSLICAISCCSPPRQCLQVWHLANETLGDLFWGFSVVWKHNLFGVRLAISRKSRLVCYCSFQTRKHTLHHNACIVM